MLEPIKVSCIQGLECALGREQSQKEVEERDRGEIQARLQDMWDDDESELFYVDRYAWTHRGWCLILPAGKSSRVRLSRLGKGTVEF